MSKHRRPGEQITLSAWTKKHALVIYFVLAYVISWAIELPLAASAQGWLQARVSFALHYLAAFGPMLAALIVIAITEGSDGIHQILLGLAEWRVGIRWFLFSILSPICLFGVAVQSDMPGMKLGQTCLCWVKWITYPILGHLVHSCFGS